MYRVEISFGHHCPNGKPLPAHRIAEVEKWALQWFCALFRGAKIKRHDGAYQNAKGHMIIEPSTTIWSYAPQVPQAWLRLMARQIRRELEQESVLLYTEEVNGTLEWIGPSNSSHAEVGPITDAAQRVMPARSTLIPIL